MEEFSMLLASQVFSFQETVDPKHGAQFIHWFGFESRRVLETRDSAETATAIELTVHNQTLKNAMILTTIFSAASGIVSVNCH